jgi:4-hydroxy-3-methylbut-2-en-1-yl diphosphate reductase
MLMIVEIDEKSGFCFGVVHAIKAAERALGQAEQVYCLGDIVHNSKEVERLASQGLKVINHREFSELKNCQVLIRAHGEPPETYRIAKENGITLIDATCPIVLNLQRRIRNVSEETRHDNVQIVIFGKEGHAEVIGLKGQSPGRVIVISGERDLDKIDFSRPVRFFSQTTQNHPEFIRLRDEIEQQMSALRSPSDFEAYDSICRKVSNRAPEIAAFASRHDVIIFASDPNSSNGTYLFSIAAAANPRSYFVTGADDLNPEWFTGVERVGICGATSTPQWVMEEIRERIGGMKNGL